MRKSITGYSSEDRYVDIAASNLTLNAATVFTDVLLPQWLYMMASVLKSCATSRSHGGPGVRVELVRWDNVFFYTYLIL